MALEMLAQGKQDELSVENLFVTGHPGESKPPFVLIRPSNPTIHQLTLAPPVPALQGLGANYAFEAVQAEFEAMALFAPNPSSPDEHQINLLTNGTQLSEMIGNVPDSEDYVVFTRHLDVVQHPAANSSYYHDKSGFVGGSNPGSFIELGISGYQG
ncbi:hypothetical protein CC78DRAFT_549640 [Lojkania enalia]|uniref:Uncharacterized protein n=1 Tax=Lojkania enalia TaxID=147567 RepID=A0A9P4JY13_9PLEO|nr:hypothetical protein CC78DRAFT_549640 [Didymosphaeria enalia]